jgi:hypothetical protein
VQKALKSGDGRNYDISHSAGFSVRKRSIAFSQFGECGLNFMP